MKTKNRFSSAFTLVELVVVIAIIAILASIAVPVYNKVLERGHATTCISNLSQLGISTAAYLSDNDDFPFSYEDKKAWPQILHSKYCPDWKVFRSAFDKREKGHSEKKSFNQMLETGEYVSYGINENILRQNFSVNRYTAPSQLIYMAPSVVMDDKKVRFTGHSLEQVSLKTPEKAPRDRKDYRGTHGANRIQINVLYMDTHVSSEDYRHFSQVPNQQDKDAAFRWLPVPDKQELEFLQSIPHEKQRTWDMKW